jgi:dynein heavy chain
MITFSELKKEDYDMNTILFTWLSRMGPIFVESEDLLAKARIINKDELLTRRERLGSELEGHVKQIEEYEDYGDIAEILKYLKNAQKSQSRLDNLADRIYTYNREESLFGWDATKFPLLQDTINQLSPYLVLYQTAVEFQQKFNLWMVPLSLRHGMS